VTDGPPSRDQTDVPLPVEKGQVGGPVWPLAKGGWSKVYDSYAGFVWRSLRRLGVDPASLDDLTQEVFLVAFENESGFEGRSSLKTWLYGIAFNLARRRNVARQRAPLPLPESLADEERPSQEESLSQKRAVEDLYALLDQLPDERRAVFVMAELEQFSASEIAEITGTPLNTVYSRLRLSRQDFEAAVRRLRARRAWRQP
jgi:RNA polymerase sigma-70 factor (ECF subfamily)